MKKNEKTINDKLIEDLDQICVDINAGNNQAINLQTLNDALVSIEIEKMCHANDFKELDLLAHLESAVLRIKVKLLEKVIAST